MSMGVHPANNHALVRLGQLMQLKTIAAPTGKYDTHTTGTVVEAWGDTASMSALAQEVDGKLIYFSEFKEGTKFTRDGVEYAFVKLADIEGYED